MAKKSDGVTVLAKPDDEDFRRYRQYRAGMLIDAIARAEGVTVRKVKASLNRVRAENQKYSAEAAGAEIRKTIMERLPKIGASLDDALTATSFEEKKLVTVVDGEIVDAGTETVAVPDHETRMTAVDRVRALLAVVQPRDPAVQINNNSTTNTQNNMMAVGADGSSPVNLASTESIIRSIQARRNHSFPSPALPAETTPNPDSGYVVDASAEYDETDEEPYEEGE